MVELSRTTPLGHRKADDNSSVTMREIAGRGMIDLRGHTSDRKFMAAAKSVLGFDLPKSPRTSSGFGDIKALWLSPDQWLVLCNSDKANELHGDMAKALGGTHSLAVNVSDMRAVIRLEGPHARTTIMKGTSIDLTHGEYPAGAVRRMKFAEIAALLHIVEDSVIDIYVFRSYADYTWDFLIKAARKGSEVRLPWAQA